MKSTFQPLRALLIALLVVSSMPLGAQEHASEAGPSSDDEPTVLDAIIDPQIQRRRVNEDLIDSENFSMGFVAGVLSVEDFGSNDMFGIRMAYHVTEDWFLEGTVGSTQTSETSFETLSGSTNLLSESQRDLYYYNFSLGANLLPGEVFIGKWAFNTNFYLIAGVGNTQFADNDYFTYNFGAGLRLFLTDWIAARMDFRNHLFTHNLLGEDKRIQNLEGTVGLSLYF